jgi:hypothetical protein
MRRAVLVQRLRVPCDEKGNRMRFRFLFFALVFCCLIPAENARSQTDWPSFGNDPGAMRYSSLNQINTDNVTQLKVAWQFDTSPLNATQAAQPPAGREPVPEEAPMQGAQPSGSNAQPAPTRPSARNFGNTTALIPLRSEESAIGQERPVSLRRLFMGPSMAGWSRSMRKQESRPRHLAMEGWPISSQAPSVTSTRTRDTL